MESIPRHAGVYCITCTANGKVYIGSTTNLRKRWQWHRGDLRLNRHHTRHLQFAWNKYGECAFTFAVLELVPDHEQLHIREQYWLDQYRAYDSARGYNHGKVARAPWMGRQHTQQTKKKLSQRSSTNGNIAHARQFADQWHGSDAGRAWHSDHAHYVWSIQPDVTCHCQVCGQTFITKIPKRAKYCSNNCKSTARRQKHTDHEQRTCVICGTPFLCNRYSPQKACSRQCVALSRRRDGDGRFGGGHARND